MVNETGLKQVCLIGFVTAKTLEESSVRAQHEMIQNGRASQSGEFMYVLKIVHEKLNVIFLLILLQRLQQL